MDKGERKLDAHADGERPMTRRMLIHIQNQWKKEPSVTSSFSTLFRFYFVFIKPFHSFSTISPRFMDIVKTMRQGETTFGWNVSNALSTFNNLFAFLFTFGTRPLPPLTVTSARGRITWKIELDYIQFTCDTDGEEKKQRRETTTRRLFYLFIRHSCSSPSFNSINWMIFVLIHRVASLCTCFINESFYLCYSCQESEWKIRCFHFPL